MPRPGPRPYDCVRRAWNRETRQPIRGSIIQQTFSVVLERHGLKTKKNREWQEKLLGVVFKAEEIMYSKANSEAEYMDLDTLWDRLNDAIDTIIPKDENAETGQFLPPCVEGFVPVRAPRSQRHNRSRCYLNPRTDETDVSPDVNPASWLGLKPQELWKLEDSDMVADSLGDTPNATPSNYRRDFYFFPVETSDDTSLEQTRRGPGL